MVKMENPNRKGQVKIFKESDVEAAKKLGWTEFGKPKKAKKAKKIKKTKK
tara:strand:- start:46 stop:195 length:150 start_codon:yes stop_codon:yes gene_type:complete